MEKRDKCPHCPSRELSGADDPDWTRGILNPRRGPANELGYFDQAHFASDFKAQIGKTPRGYAALTRST